MNYQCPACNSTGPFNTFALYSVSLDTNGNTFIVEFSELSKYETCHCPSCDFEADLFEFEYTKAI